jgi:hypothetical protein
MLLAVFLSRAGLERAKPNTQSDLGWHLNGAYNLLQGHGLHREVAGSHDWSQTVWEPLIYWPPGYSLAAAAIGAFAKDLLLAAWILQLLAWLIFLGSCWLLSRLLGISTQAFALAIVPFGLPFHFVSRFSCSDMPALAFFQLGTGLVLLAWRDRKGAKWFVAAGVLLFGAGFFRYAYYPVIFVPPAAVFLSGVLTKDRRSRWNAAYAAAAIVVCLGLQTAGNLRYAGSAAYVEPLGERRLHPENLARIDNFPAETFFDLAWHPWVRRVASAGRSADLAVKGIGLALAALLAAIFIRSALKQKIGKDDPEGATETLFVWISAGTVAANVISLAYLSLTFAPQTDWTAHWTYVGENRYFAPSMMCLLWWMARLASSGRAVKLWSRMPIAVLSASFLFSLAGAAADLRQGEPGTAVLISRDMLTAATKIRLLSSQMEERPVVVSPFDNAPLLSLYGARIVRMEEYPYIIADQKVYSSRPLPVLVWCPRPASAEEKLYLEITGAREIMKLRASSLYKIGTW